MKKKLILIVCLIISANTLVAQKLNGYKYIIVPNKYEFLKIKDEYKLNSLTKFLFEKEGFISLFKDDKKPSDLYNNPCLGLTANFIKKSSFFKTTLIFELENCRNEIIFTSNKGTSRLKEYKPSYHEAVRGTFTSLKAQNYVYNNNPIISNYIEEKVTITTPEKVNENHSNITGTHNEPTTERMKMERNILYAQKTANGFQLVNNKPEIKYILLNSEKKDVFHLKNKKGIIYKNNSEWYLEIYNNGQMISRQIVIKF